ncbi:MAG: tyrosine--tRNA ligase [Hydrogenobaculum sp.]|jgi:tyrosyl-tRNA synthetase (EC 6.1.1.1)|uniref:tyrosine--tRNA ligase n=1 Tax=unclassified Hydrogenobaculum TaxID=2622382 RepID=UPI0001C515FA|nr:MULTISPECIES: tyrosine--tRNA ligase [unclassified Hydrogenobaculum]AEF19024.1 tyrosyl-tRNA synthetase [Hydrogenobaculum sp. 3684]AEG46311.1 Tyrosyl-tRNA synthetase [Hydrogenobaculum sp. SHO]AGG14956.1 tyrosyl-tRNA synthetase [Hydrogenobaculum sp. HO]AGH93252.1 tyrosyl-tRNA synthetase [Hydrogenobaculum sp. SN]
MDIQKQLEIIQKGTVEIIEKEELIEKLKKGKPLVVKAGFDPTAKDLHLGHTVLLQKLRDFQNLGHEIIFLIGDFTAMIGDPTGRNETRPPLSKEEVLENAKTYQEQVFKILDKDKTKILYNSEWLSTMTTKDIVNLASKYTVARMLERDDFQKRYKEGSPIHIHEFLYPLFQGYDSVVLKADIEIGGSDQKFNLLVGRELQKDYGLEKQVCITMPLLVGIDGVKKMSKSYGNYIALKDDPKDMFGKIMSISDELMYDYYTLLTDKTPDEIEKIKAMHPMEAKKQLAYIIVSRFHSEEKAKEAKEFFESTFSQKEFPKDAPVFSFSDKDSLKAYELIVKIGFAPSNNEARRIISGGGLRINGEKITDPNKEIVVENELRVQVGKKHFAIIKKA